MDDVAMGQALNDAIAKEGQFAFLADTPSESLTEEERIRREKTLLLGDPEVQDAVEVTAPEVAVSNTPPITPTELEETPKETEIPASQPRGLEETPKETEITASQVPDQKTDEEEKFPMVTRVDQQAFKDAKGKTERMDAVQQEAKEGERVRKRGRSPVLKRPAAAKRSAKAKVTPPKPSTTGMASPVVGVVSSDEGEDITPKNLNGEFENVADEPPKVKTPPAKPRGSKKAAPSGSAGKERKTKDRKKGEDKSKATEGKKDQKKKTKEKKKTPMKAKKTPVKTKGGKQEAKEGEDEKVKKTFAGRRSPKQPLAKQRFQTLKSVFEKRIQPWVASNGSYLEARVWPKNSKH